MDGKVTMSVSRSKLDQALTIINRLREAGFTALYAGGWVRDYLLGRPSQDVDIATSASPEEVLHLFQKAIPVGVQFGVVRVIIDRQEFEVASFRSDTQYVDGRRPAHVTLHSSPEEDAQRRDFTVNGMFFDPTTNTVLDYVGGRDDICHRIIRTIGSPHLRFSEDRLRIVRAIRFKNTLQFSVDPATWKAICQESRYVKDAVSPERIWQELQKMHDKGVLAESIHDMAECGLLQNIFPILSQTPSRTLKPTILALQKIRTTSLAAAIGLLFLENHSSYYPDLVKEYPLSKSEAKILSFFSTYGDFSVRLLSTQYVQEYAKPEFWEYLQAVACLRKNPSIFLRRHKKRMEELSFWIAQVKNNSFLIGGEDVKNLGVAPGKFLGQLLKDVFLYSITNRITSKKALVAWLRRRL